MGRLLENTCHARTGIHHRSACIIIAIGILQDHLIGLGQVGGQQPGIQRPLHPGRLTCQNGDFTIGALYGIQIHQRAFLYGHGHIHEHFPAQVIYRMGMGILQRCILGHHRQHTCPQAVVAAVIHDINPAPGLFGRMEQGKGAMLRRTGIGLFAQSDLIGSQIIDHHVLKLSKVAVVHHITEPAGRPCAQIVVFPVVLTALRLLPADDGLQGLHQNGDGHPLFPLQRPFIFPHVEKTVDRGVLKTIPCAIRDKVHTNVEILTMLLIPLQLGDLPLGIIGGKLFQRKEGGCGLGRIPACEMEGVEGSHGLPFPYDQLHVPQSGRIGIGAIQQADLIGVDVVQIAVPA